MSKIDKALAFRQALDATLAATRKLIRVDELTAEELAEMRMLYPAWEIGKSYTDEVVRYGDRLYKVIQSHTSQDDWTPDVTPALFNLIQPPGVIPEWVQPTGGHDAYKKGDLVLFEGKTYKSLIDANTYSPTDYPDGWELQP